MGRTLPNNNDAEKSVLGSILLDNKVYIDVAEILTSEDYYNPLHVEMFNFMGELHRKKEPIDIVTLPGLMKNVEDLDQYILNLMDLTPTVENVMHYVKIVENKSRLRKQIRGCNESIKTALEGENPDEVTGIMENTIINSNKKSISAMNTFGELMQNFLVDLQNRCETKGKIPGVPTGFADLDFKLAGLQKGGFYLIGARPAMGKTAFVLNIADFIGVKLNLPVALFNLEMTKEQLMNREVSAHGNIDANKLRFGNLNEGEWQEIADMLNVIGGAPIVIDDTPRMKVTDIKARARRVKNKYGDLGVIFIDYLQLITPASKCGTREQEVSEISRELKIMAKELETPVVCLSQLSRQCEQRQDKRPMLSDLRESGAIEQDADVVMFLYRDDYYNPDTEKRNIAEVIIAKHRTGSTGTIELAWLGQYTKFCNLEKWRGENENSNQGGNIKSINQSKDRFIKKNRQWCG